MDVVADQRNVPYQGGKGTWKGKVDTLFDNFANHSSSASKLYLHHDTISHFLMDKICYFSAILSRAILISSQRHAISPIWSFVNLESHCSRTVLEISFEWYRIAQNG